ncbi:Arm DNA-binding domain-containing protein [Sphingomonas bacterium]|uniref:Arm DNA-binding domain-containing protein n=1 Tax=Sphingomonas bacterium TaxID=1895847 RepID=UPI0026216FEF|nr:Arm DNA-binding domain-containing protein [Sphingomonas bacterium]
MLTDATIRKAKPRDKDYKLADAGGLYLFVTKSGHRSWRLKYRFDGKERRPRARIRRSRPPWPWQRSLRRAFQAPGGR